MFNSKFAKITALIISLLILSGICFFVFRNQNKKEISLINIPNEEISDENIAKETQIQEEPKEENITNPVQKYYIDYLEKDVNNFLENAKISKNNDIEFNKLQTKFIKATDVLNEKYIDNIDIKDSYYKNNWVKLPRVEGTYFYSVNSEYLLEKYGQYLSSAYKKWLEFNIKRETVMQDGGLTIAPDKLREYIIFLEKFINENPDFILIADAKDILRDYLMTYLEGIDNSPIFDKWNSRTMLPEYKESYEKFLSENKNSKYYPMVEELYNKSKANNFSWDRDFDAWLWEYHKKYFE